MAKGEPTPTYTWTKNGELYEPNTQDARIFMANDSGLLTFTQPQSIDQGWYLCSAKNSWGKFNRILEVKRIMKVLFLGTAITRRVRVRLAIIDEFPRYDRPQVIQVKRGDSLKIPCNPPTGVPDSEVYWTDNTNSGDQIGFPILNSRIQQDHDGLFL